MTGTPEKPETTASRYGPRPAARLVSYYEFDPEAGVTCGACGWKGRAGDGSREYHQELFDTSCPRCDRMLLIISYPTDYEVRAAAAAGNLQAVEDLEGVERADAYTRRFDAVELKNAEQLPALGGEDLKFEWDFADDGEHRWTLIRRNERIIWRELVPWEGLWRFDEVKDLLKRRYGERFSSLTPTPASELYLYGDDLGASTRLSTN